MRFVHLHLHSEYSLLDGAARIADIPAAAAAAGHEAVALTDHGVLYGAVAFYRACRDAGVKPIIGCEVYVAPRSRFRKEGRQDQSGHHLVLLVENEIGYRNLITLVSKSFTEGFYSKPRVDSELLEAHSEGLIALSACLAGRITALRMTDVLFALCRPSLRKPGFLSLPQMTCIICAVSMPTRRPFCSAFRRRA